MIPKKGGGVFRPTVEIGIPFKTKSTPMDERRHTMKAIQMIRRIARREEGQTLSEYALILILIAVVTIVAVALLGNQITAVLNTIANAL